MEQNQELHQQFEQALQSTQDVAQGSLDVALCLESVDAVQELRLEATDEVQLSEKQQAMVQAFASGNKNPEVSRVLGVVEGEAALESFTAAVDTIAKSAIKALTNSVPEVLEHSSKALGNYHDLSRTLLDRMRKLRALLSPKQDDKVPQTTMFTMGAHARFLQCNGKEIQNFEQFKEVFEQQCTLATHAFIHGVNYSTLVTDRILSDIQKLQDPMSKDLREDLRKSIEYHWSKVWKEGFVVKNPGVVPPEFLREFTESKIYPVCALFDARQLVATAPQKPRDTQNAGKYRAVVAFDKKSPVKPSGAFETPTAKDILPVVDAAIALLNDMMYYKELAGKCKKASREFAKARSRMLDSVENKPSADSMQSVVQYMQLAASCGQIMVSPHIELAWMHLRSCLVVASIAEHVLFNNSKEMAVSQKFFADAKGPVASMDQERSVVSSMIAAIVKAVMLPG